MGTGGSGSALRPGFGKLINRQNSLFSDFDPIGGTTIRAFHFSDDKPDSVFGAIFRDLLSDEPYRGSSFSLDMTFLLFFPNFRVKDNIKVKKPSPR